MVFLTNSKSTQKKLTAFFWNWPLTKGVGSCFLIAYKMKAVLHRYFTEKLRLWRVLCHMQGCHIFRSVQCSCRCHV